MEIKNENSGGFIKLVAYLCLKQNKLDNQTRLSKFNELIISEIFDNSGLRRLKRLDPHHANIEVSESFNIDPHFNFNKRRALNNYFFFNSSFSAK